MDHERAAIVENHRLYVEVSTAAGKLLDELDRSQCDYGLDRRTIAAYDALAALVGHEPWINQS
jgi:hypothetical protein